MDSLKSSSFGELLQHFRHRRGFTQQQAAAQIGASRNSISYWERGEFLPETLSTVLELARVLDLSEEERRLLIEARFGTASVLPLHHLPTGRNPYFTGRESVLVLLHQQLTNGKRVALSQAISGLGGIGKSQTALEYAYRYQQYYHDILWAGAESRESLVTAYISLARLLYLHKREEQEQRRIVEAVKHWLATHKRWLLILDNVEDLSLLTAFLPPQHQGHVLLTTRLQVTEPVALVFELKGFTDEEGALLLLRRTKRLAPDDPLDTALPQEYQQARTISQMLGGLPLAIDQAGAYILETGCSLMDYPSLYEQRHAVLLARRGSVPSDHPESVTTTFSLAIERLVKKNPVAVDLLRMCAFLAPDAIPETLVREGLTLLRSDALQNVRDSFAFDEAIESLRNFSLIQRHSERRMLEMHRLVQLVLKDGLSEAKQKDWTAHCIHLLNQAFPAVKRTVEQWEWCEQLISHVLIYAMPPLFEEFPDLIEVLNKAASYLRERARYAEAELILQQVLAIRKRQLEAGHPDIATSFRDLGLLYHDMGKYESAESFLQQAFTIRSKILGMEHTDTAMALHNLGMVYHSQHKYELAEPFYQQALIIRQKLLGMEHADTAISFGNLADLYANQAKYELAEPLMLQSLAILEKTFGIEHPQLILPLNNLAYLYEHQMKYKQAMLFYERALSICEGVLGMEHPSSANTLNNIATLYKKQGNFAMAKPLYERSLAIYRKTLGEEHPHTKTVQLCYDDLRQLQSAREVSTPTPMAHPGFW